MSNWRAEQRASRTDDQAASAPQAEAVPEARVLVLPYSEQAGEPGGAPRRRRWRRWAAGSLILAVLAAVVGVVLTRGGGDVGAVAELRRSVEVGPGGGSFVPVREYPQVKAGDVVRTDSTGLGEIEYGDGSLTRLDADTTFEVETLATGSRREVQTRLEVGRVWNRVEKLASTEDRFEVHTANAVATVRGTAFGVVYRPPVSMVIVFEGEVETESDGVTKALGAGQCTKVFKQGEHDPCDFEKEAAHPFFVAMAKMDGLKIPGKGQPEQTQEGNGSEGFLLGAPANLTGPAPGPNPNSNAPSGPPGSGGGTGDPKKSDSGRPSQSSPNSGGGGGPGNNPPANPPAPNPNQPSPNQPIPNEPTPNEPTPNEPPDVPGTQPPTGPNNGSGTSGPPCGAAGDPCSKNENNPHNEDTTNPGKSSADQNEDKGNKPDKEEKQNNAGGKDKDD